MNGIDRRRLLSFFAARYPRRRVWPLTSPRLGHEWRLRRGDRGRSRRAENCLGGVFACTLHLSAVPLFPARQNPQPVARQRTFIAHSDALGSLILKRRPPNADRRP